MERSDYFLERSDRKMERSDLERSDRIPWLLGRTKIRSSGAKRLLLEIPYMPEMYQVFFQTFMSTGCTESPNGEM